MNARTSPKRRLAAISALTLALLAPGLRADITYTLHFDPASSPEAQQVANSVAVVAAFYNQQGSFNKHWSVYYNAGIPTAEANADGYMGFGGSRNERVVFHEAAHTFGMGTTTAYANLIAGGVWGGQYGNQAQSDTYNDFGDGLHGDGHAIWPGGFNYDSEDGYLERFWHTRIMVAIRCDMGILANSKEARNELVHPGRPLNSGCPHQSRRVTNGREMEFRYRTAVTSRERPVRCCKLRMPRRRTREITVAS